MITAIFCTFTTVIGMFVDVFIRWNDFGQSMKNIVVGSCNEYYLGLHLLQVCKNTDRDVCSNTGICLETNQVLNNDKISNHIVYIKEGVTRTERCLFQA